MQGREADASSLSSAAIPTSRRARFAREHPNLLNVAVTRAKRRLYVIGNHETLGQRRYFNVLAARIPAGYPASDVG